MSADKPLMAGRGEAVGGRGEAVAGRGEAVGGRGEAVVGRGEAVGGRGEVVGGRGEAVAGRGEAVGGDPPVVGIGAEFSGDPAGSGWRDSLSPSVATAVPPTAFRPPLRTSLFFFSFLCSTSLLTLRSIADSSEEVSGSSRPGLK